MNRYLKYWTANERFKSKYVRKYRKKFSKVLREQIKPITDYIPTAPNPEAVITAIPVLMKSDGLTAVFNELYLDLGLVYADRYYRQLERANNASKSAVLDNYEWIWSQAMIEYVNDPQGAGFYITSIIGTSQAVAVRVIQQATAQALEQGLSIPDTMDLLEKKVPTAWRNTAIWRSELIARTEVLTASNYGAQMGAESMAKDYGLVLQKRWVTRLDGREREDHRQANGSTVDMNDTFTVGGETMQRPGDPSGGAKNRCNCRCAVVFERADGESSFSQA